MNHLETDGPSARGTINAASASAAATDTGTANDQPQNVRLGFRLSGRDHMAIKANIDPMRPGAVVMKQSRREYELALSKAGPPCLPRRLFMEPVVKLGTLATGWADNIDVEGGAEYPEVVFSDTKLEENLTAAFSRPDILGGVFASTYGHVTTADPAMAAMVIALRVKRRAVFVVVATTLVAAAGAAVGVGIASDDVQAGLACFAGITAIPSVLLPLLFWMAK